jgi:mannonate dehydratase
VDCYAHASGRDPAQVVESVQQLMAEGYRHIRIQLGGYGSPQLSGRGDFEAAGFGLPVESHMDPGPYCRAVPRLFAAVREKCGEAIQLLHDVHERIPPIEAVRLCKDVEPYRPFFIEDPFSPEDIGWFKILRPQTSVPLAMGELFNSPHEWTPLMAEKLIDFIRIHVSQAGGLTPCRKIAALGEFFGVKTAWHGPGDVSPIGHAANVTLDLVAHNFGIQEGPSFPDPLKEVFTNCPVVKNGYMYANEGPGWGMEVNESVAKKFPYGTRERGERQKYNGGWGTVRRRDGTIIKQ